jgi:hypothetical protein
MLTKYERVLEAWDDKVAVDWIEPDTPYLNCDDWLLGNATYENSDRIVKSYIREAFLNVDEFFRGFEPILVSYWENERTDFELLKNERLEYQAEVLHALLVRYAH